MSEKKNEKGLVVSRRGVLGSAAGAAALAGIGATGVAGTAAHASPSGKA